MDEICPGQLRCWRDDHPLYDTLTDGGLLLILDIDKDHSTLENLAWTVLSSGKTRFFYDEDILEFTDIVDESV